MSGPVTYSHEDSIAVIRMDGVTRTPVCQLLRRLPEECESLLIHELKLASGRQNRYQSVDAVDEHTKRLFALA